MLPPSPDPSAQVTADAGSARLRNPDRFSLGHLSPVATRHRRRKAIRSRLKDFQISPSATPSNAAFPSTEASFICFLLGMHPFVCLRNQGK